MWRQRLLPIGLAVATALAIPCWAVTASTPARPESAGSRVRELRFAQRLSRTRLEKVQIGVNPHGAKGAGHFGLLLEFRDGTRILTHKTSSHYITSMSELVESFTHGFPQLVFTQIFRSAPEFEQVAAGWQFQEIALAAPEQVTEAWLARLEEYARSPRAPYNVANNNCQSYVIDLVLAGRPLHWTFDDVYSLRPVDTFAEIVRSETDAEVSS